jgi:hypothetical protein
MRLAYLVYTIAAVAIVSFAATRSTVVAEPPPAGECPGVCACCLPDGTCTMWNEIPEAQCVALGGTFHPTTPCKQLECSVIGPGSCCYPNKTCDTDMTEGNCIANGGWYEPEWDYCFNNPCIPPTSCCFPLTGECVDEMPASECAAGGGFFDPENGCATAGLCEPSGELCFADLDGDFVVGISDFLGLLASWGPNPGHPADLDGDDLVGINDFLALLANWGPCQ